MARTVTDRGTREARGRVGQRLVLLLGYTVPPEPAQISSLRITEEHGCLFVRLLQDRSCLRVKSASRTRFVFLELSRPVTDGDPKSLCSLCTGK